MMYKACWQMWQEQSSLLARAEVHMQHMPPATEISARGTQATVRINALAAGWGDLPSKGDLEVKGRGLALLSRPPLPLLSLENAHISPKGSFPVHTAGVITCVWDRTWTATTTELFGINTQQQCTTHQGRGSNPRPPLNI